MFFKLILNYESKVFNIIFSCFLIVIVIGLKCIKKIEKDVFGCSKVNLLKI